MKALKADNKYGYKVLYRENSRGVYIRYFMTYTLNQAVLAKRYYVQYPQRSRIDNHLLRNPDWIIRPITKAEYDNRIWDELPF